MNASVEEWRGDFHTFLQAAQGQDAPAWTLPYEERRLASKEERIVKQLALESSWTATPTHGLWKRLRAFAAPHRDFELTQNGFCQFLTSIGITSPTYHARIWGPFAEGLAKSPSEPLNALCVAKTIDVGLCDDATCSQVLRHCFNSLPLTRSDQLAAAPGEDVLLVSDIAKALEQGKCNKTALPPSVAPEVLETLHACLTNQQFTAVSFDDFCAMFMSSTNPNFGEIFAKQVMEACGKYFKEPFGTLPRIPPRWLEDILPVPFNSAVPADADALLLQDAERLGVPSGPKARKAKTPKPAKKAVNKQAV